MRAETGKMQFGKDWPGVFIRGDHALYLAEILKWQLKNTPLTMIENVPVEGLVSLLRSADAHVECKTQRMKAFDDCVEEE